MKEIKPDNEVINSEEFQKDKYKFYILLKNLSSKELELYSDEENYIICRGGKQWPTWIWTKDNMDKSIIPEIEEGIRMYLLDEGNTKFTCKKELYDELVARNFEELNLEEYFEMGFLICHQTKETRKNDGVLDRPNEEDRTVLEEYWYKDNQEMNGVNPITREQATKDVDMFIKSNEFFVLRNPDGKIVSMANYSVVDGLAKLSHVYTPDEERRKGYAAYLIYLMTNDLITKGYIPLLYTDYNYIPSNKAYINAGYEDEGILINFSCSKRK